jgi:hypothetical protein
MHSSGKHPCAPLGNSIEGKNAQKPHGVTRFRRKRWSSVRYACAEEPLTFIRTRLGPFDLVMLEVGAYHPSWGDIHLGPVNAMKAWELLGGGAFLPVHWGTFSLAMHAWDEPAETLLALGQQQGAPLVMPRLGEAVEPGTVDRVDPWWRTVEQTTLAPLPAEPQPTLPKSMPWPVD